MSGTVYAHVGQPFSEPAYDVVIVGAGRMGSALAHALLSRTPALRLLLAEEGGLPNEEGATVLAPGIWHSAPGAPPPQRARAARTAGLLGERLERRGLLRLSAEREEGSRPLGELVGGLDLPPGLIDPAALPWARLDPQAGTYSPATRTLSDAQAAVRLGADLMLNARCALIGQGERGGQGENGAPVELARLTVTGTHQIVVGQRCRVRAAAVVVAAGAAGPALLEAGLGTVTRHRAAYRQAPRLNLPSGERTPLLELGEPGQILRLRPHSGGFVLVPPITHPDPWGHVPLGGRLAGVPTGLRRELLELLLPLMEPLPGLGGGELVLGRSLADVPGAWLALPQGGWPLWERVDPQHWLLLGGPRADLTGPALAEELAEALVEELETGELAEKRSGAAG